MYILPYEIQENILQKSYRLYYSETVLPDMKMKSLHMRQVINTKYKYDSVVDELNYHLPYVRGCEGMKFICNSYLDYLKICHEPLMLLETYFESFVFFYLVMDKEFAIRFEPYTIHLSLIETYYNDTISKYINSQTES